LFELISNEYLTAEVMRLLTALLRKNIVFQTRYLFATVREAIHLLQTSNETQTTLSVIEFLKEASNFDEAKKLMTNKDLFVHFMLRE
jgi:predicted proteasome-type protease